MVGVWCVCMVCVRMCVRVRVRVCVYSFSFLPFPILPYTPTQVHEMWSMRDAEISPVCAILGGMVGQEVVKYISMKDEPICNFFLYDGSEAGGGGSGTCRRWPTK